MNHHRRIVCGKPRYECNEEVCRGRSEGTPNQNVSSIRKIPKMFKGKIMNLTVIEKDARTVHQPHSDALVITSVIVNVHASTVGRQWEFCKYFSLWHISEIEAFG